MDRKSGVAATLLLAAGMSYRGGAPKGPAGVAPGVGNSSLQAMANGKRTSGAGPWVPVCNYFRTEAIQDGGSAKLDIKIDSANPKKTLKANLIVSSEEANEEGDPLAQFCVPPDPKPQIKVLIATVPDPELTHMALSFDRYIESITWAVADGDGADERYTFEGFWFPWRVDDKEETDPEKRRAAQADQEERLTKPGLLLFRRRVDPDRLDPLDRLLLVFLVGETPTSGINRIAFHNAWNYATSLKTKDLEICGSGACMGILGPSFSGSVPSLSRLLRRARVDQPGSWVSEPVRNSNPPEKIFVISGAVTSPPKLPGFDFCTTVESDVNAVLAFRDYLGSKAGRFAFLVEDETAYGENFAESIFPILKEKTTTGDWHPLLLRYPRGIAGVRNSVEELPGLASPSQQSAGSYPQLPLNLRDAGKDSIPSFSRQQTPVSQEAVLIELAATLKREDIRYVGVTATEPLDALFVSRFVHAAAPDIRLVVLDTDLLFARAAQKWGLEGMLAISSYPLLSRNQNYAKASRPRRIQFASGLSEGEYNACRRMLLPAANLPPRKPPLPPDPPCGSSLTQDQEPRQDYLLDYAAPFAEPGHATNLPVVHKPPVWVTILGRDDWWPVAVVTPKPGSKLASTLLNGPQPAAHPNEEFTIENSPRLWCIFFWLIAVACAAHVAGVFLMNFWYWNSPWKCFRLRILGWGFRPSLVPSRRALLATASLVVAVTSGSLAAVAYVSGLGAQSGNVEVVFAGAVAAAALAEAIWAALTWRYWLMIAGCAASIIAFSRIWAWKTLPSDLHLVKLAACKLAAYRAVHIESGVSPLLPLVFALLAIYLFFWFRLQQFRSREDRSPRLLPASDLQLPADIDDIQPSSTSPGPLKIVFTLGAVSCWLLFINPWGALVTLEVGGYDLATGTIFAILVGLLALTVVRFVAGWEKVQRLLQALERHPLRYAFTRLPKDFSWTAIWTGDPQPTLVTQSRSLDALRLVPGGSDCVVCCRTSLEQLTDPKRRVSNYSDVEDLEEVLNAAAASIAIQLAKTWDEGSSESISCQKKQEDLAKLRGVDRAGVAAEEFVALRYVAFIRYALLQMRSFLEFLMYGFILLVVALNLYPFQGQHQIGIALIVVFLVAGGCVVRVFAQMDRNPLLSRLSETKPNELSGNFVWRLVSFGALPLITLVAAQVPAVGDFLLSWVQPTLQAFK